MEQAFENIRDKTRESQLPEMDDVKELVRLSRLLHHNVDEDFAPEAEDFSLMAQKLFHAVKRDDIEESVMIVDSLEDLDRLLPYK